MELIGSIFILLGAFAFLIGAWAVCFPIKSLGFAQRRDGVLVMVASGAVFVLGQQLAPELGKEAAADQPPVRLADRASPNAESLIAPTPRPETVAPVDPNVAKPADHDAQNTKNGVTSAPNSELEITIAETSSQERIVTDPVGEATRFAREMDRRSCRLVSIHQPAAGQYEVRYDCLDQTATFSPLPVITPHARDTTTILPPSVRQAPNSGSGTVQVRGYYRKDGTYVRPHTRRAPQR